MPASPSPQRSAGSKTQQNGQLLYEPEENYFPPGATKEYRAQFFTSLGDGFPPALTDLLGPLVQT